jgi:hypothetical protein
MNRRDYLLHVAGRQAAASGAGLSDAPYGGRDGDLWRGGVRSWLDENGKEDPDAIGDLRPQAVLRDHLFQYAGDGF